MNMKILAELLGRMLLYAAIFIFVLFFILMLGGAIASVEQVYQTDDPADYGTISGNSDNDEPAEFIWSFFPDKIEPFFSDVTYHYYASNQADYACECYLEFTIEDPNQFQRILHEVVDVNKACVFAYDEAYMEYTFSNLLMVDWSDETEAGYRISEMQIGKVLYSVEAQRLIFVAICVQDGGSAVRASQLSYFFDKFGIDLVEYHLSAYASYRDEQEGITYQDCYDLGIPTPYAPPDTE